MAPFRSALRFATPKCAWQFRESAPDTLTSASPAGLRRRVAAVWVLVMGVSLSVWIRPAKRKEAQHNHDPRRVLIRVHSCGVGCPFWEKWDCRSVPRGIRRPSGPTGELALKSLSANNFAARHRARHLAKWQPRTIPVPAAAVAHGRTRIAWECRAGAVRPRRLAPKPVREPEGSPLLAAGRPAAYHDEHLLFPWWNPEDRSVREKRDGK
jgi:hypothetical protein